MVVTTIIALLAAITFPTLQLVRQREKENRLREILRYVRTQGIGLSASMSNAGSDNNLSGLGSGYRNYVVRKVFAQIDVASAALALKEGSSGVASGALYPLNPAKLVNPLNEQVKLPMGYHLGLVATVTVTIKQRFIRNVPPHPFLDWYPNAHFEYKAVNTTSVPPGSLFTAEAWPADARGVIDIVSRGAGLAINGENTDDW
jgi:hypothetical protein